MRSSPEDPDRKGAPPMCLKCQSAGDPDDLAVEVAHPTVPLAGPILEASEPGDAGPGFPIPDPGPLPGPVPDPPILGSPALPPETPRSADLGPEIGRAHV